MFYKKRTALMIGAALSATSFSSSIFAADGNDVLEMPELTVTADPLGGRTADELVAPTTIVSGEALQRRQASTLGETLDGLPGVANADFGPGVGRPVIRGLQGARVKMLNDGLGVSDISGEGADHTVAVGTAGAQQIEIIRGPATLFYGGNASGGVVNVESGRFSPVFDQPKLNGDVAYGYNGEVKQGNLGLNIPLNENLIIRADASTFRNDDYDIDGYQEIGQTEGDKDTLQNSDTETNNLGLSTVWADDWGFVGIGYSYWETDYGIPEVYLGEGEEEQERILADSERFDFRSETYNPLKGIQTARFKLAYTDFNQKENATHFDDGELEEEHTEMEFFNEQTEARLELVHNPIGLWEGVVGFEFIDRDFSAEGEGHHHEEEEEEEEHDEEEHEEHGGDGFYIRENTTQSFAAFLLEKRETDFGSVELSTRLDYIDSKPVDLDEEREIDPENGQDHIEQEGTIGDRDFTPFSLAAGSIIDVGSAHHIRLSLSRTQRAPSPDQLYAFGEHHASGTVEIGDPDLDMETYTNLEVGFDRHEGAFRYETTVFYNDVSDYIYLSSVEDGSGNATYIDGNQLVENLQDDAEFYGAEFTSAWNVIEGSIPLTLRFSGDYVRAKLKDGGNLPRITPARLGVGFDTGIQDFSFSMDYRHVFEQDDTAELETETDGYDLVSLDAGWKPSSLKGLGFYIKGRNLLNEDGRNHTSFLKDNAPIVGRAVYAGLRFDFD